jgi:DNA modification methylase
MNYQAFLEQKEIVYKSHGHICHADLSNAFPFQQDIIRWATQKGRCAIFADCGMGKTIMQLKWADSVYRETGGNILILSPLAVAHQTRKEGQKFGVTVNVCRKQNDVKPGINITNYEMLNHFEPSAFSGIVADEGGIMKNYSGAIRNEIINAFCNTPYRLSCTATPSPNDYMELGNQSEFLGVMTRTEMLAMFFVHDGGDTSQWRLKKHAVLDFWKWLSSWSVMIKKPSDLGYDDDGFNLPPLNIEYHKVDIGKPMAGELFKRDAITLDEQREARKSSIEKRIEVVKELIGQKQDEQWLIWSDLNIECDSLKKGITGIIDVRGSDPIDFKEKTMLGFSTGDVLYLSTKAKIAGHGMNWQSCHNMIFFGLSHSYESFYQAVRRCWRFGQKNPVNVHVIISDIEQPIIDNIQRKHELAETMAVEMVKNMAEFTKAEITQTHKDTSEYIEETIETERYTLYLGDCVEQSKNIASESIGYTIFSPPFSSLFTYSNSPRDLGNSKSDIEFYEHFKFLVKELYRITIPGRLVSFHCMNIPAMKERDGYIGIKDFRGDLIYLFQQNGFIYHSEVCIWKDPLIEATRTKSLGLMHKQLQKDSSRCRQGLPDYIVTMRKPEDNPIPIKHPEGLTKYIGEKEIESGVLSHNIWRRYASPVWFDINQTRTLNKNAARGECDERHICPLSLDTIERCMELWSTKDDIVFSPFGGIGSEPYTALKMGRKAVAIELKESYFRQMARNIETIQSPKQLKLI